MAKDENKKGKGPDPRNWGAAGLEPDELNVEVQEQLLKRARKNLNVDIRK